MKQKLTIILFMILSINVAGQDVEVVSPVPIDSINSVIEYGYKMHPIYLVEKLCNHIEYVVSKGTDIYSITDGTVIFADQSDNGWGLNIDIQVNDTIIIKYGHLNKILVEKDEIIKQGQVIGLCGSTGLSTSPHLGMRVEVNGEPVNPRDIYNLPKKN